MTEESEYTNLKRTGPQLEMPVRTDSAQSVLEVARQLLEQGRSDEALAAIEKFAASTGEASGHSVSQPVFDAGVSDQELEVAFESAESEREQMIDADEIAERAIRQTEPEVNHDMDEIPSFEDDFVESGSSYATRTVATLLERQGDAPTAQRIRAIVDSSQQEPISSPRIETGASKPPIRDRRTATIMELERWLVNLRGVTQ